MIRFFILSLMMTGSAFALWMSTSLWSSTGWILHAIFSCVVCAVCVLVCASVATYYKRKPIIEAPSFVCGFMLGGGALLSFIVWPILSMCSDSCHNFFCRCFWIAAVVSCILAPFAYHEKKMDDEKKEKEREYWGKIRKENEQRRAEQERIAQEQARQEEERRKREEALRREKEEQERRRRQESIRNMHSQAASDCMETGSQNPSGDSWESFFSRK